MKSTSITSPPKFELVVLTWLAIYPVINMVLYFSGPLPLVVRTLIPTLVLVPLMVYLLIPMLQRFFRSWLK